MPPPDSPPDQIPLIVDLDGTVIKTDLMWESIARLFRRNPFSVFQMLFWWTRGRAFLKKQLVRRVKIDPAILHYNEKFLAWLREQKSAGRKIILATASDLQMAKPVADHVGIFDDVLASDGKTNLRSENKLKKLVAKFGERGFDYAGNSSADLAVWRGAREAIVVHASAAVQKKAASVATVAAIFSENYSPFPNLKNFLAEFFIRSGYLIAIAAGLLLAAAFQKINVAGFAWIAPALLIFAAHRKDGGDAFRAGCVGGLSFWLASLYWLLLMPVAGYPILGWIALSAFLALFFGAWTWLTSRWGERPREPQTQSSLGSPVVSPHTFWVGRLLWSLSGAAVWVALEMIRARIFTGFPWSFIGVSQFQMTPLIQFASFTGVYGVSFLVVWASLSLFSAVRMILEKSKMRFAWQSEIFLPLFVVAGLFAHGEIKINSQNPPASTLRVTLIQPSVPQTLIWDETENSNRFQQLLQLSKNALTNKTDLLVWPESALPDFDTESYDAIVNLVRSNHVWMIFNADDWPGAGAPVFNAAFLLDPDGVIAAIYHKQKLVVFGEYIPLVRWLPFLKWFTPITDGYGAGNSAVQFEINLNWWGEAPGEPFEATTNLISIGSRGRLPRQIINTSPLICFEDTFPQLARKATRDDTDFLVNLTNDGWFGDGAEQWQHMANSVFRAVENDVPLVRCCNNGVTCWIDANGRVREIFRDANGSVYGMGAMTIDLPLRNHAQTFYNRHGDWFGWSCVIMAVITALRKLFL